MDVWFIEANLLPSQDWDSEIRTAVQNSDVLIALHSKDSLEKEEPSYPDIPWVLEILPRKSIRSNPIITFRLDDHLVSTSLHTWEIIDYFPKHQRTIAYQSLLDSLKARANQLGMSLNVDLRHDEPENFL